MAKGLTVNGQTIEFYPKKGADDQLLHIETHGCIVNIRTWVIAEGGRQVTTVRVVADGKTDNGELWFLGEPGMKDFIRVVKEVKGGEDSNDGT